MLFCTQLSESDLIVEVREKADLVDFTDSAIGRVQASDKYIFPIGEVLKINEPFLRCFLAIPCKGKLQVPTEVGIVLSAEGLIFFENYKSAGL